MTCTIPLDFLGTPCPIRIPNTVCIQKVVCIPRFLDVNERMNVVSIFYRLRNGLSLVIECVDIIRIVYIHTRSTCAPGVGIMGVLEQ